MAKTRYRKYDPRRGAELVLNYLTSMVDERRDFLPYWLVGIHVNPAFARHCRVDDAELVASWYEAIAAARDVLGTEEGAEVQAAFRRHLLRSWGPHGLRFHANYPWTRTMHSSFHEMGYVLGALNRCLTVDPDDKQAERRAAGLCRGLRELVIDRQVLTFWSGDWPVEEKTYEFPNDVYLLEAGFDLTRMTGRGEQCIRNAVLLRPLAVRYEQSGDERARDLAEGLANHLLGVSRYFSWNMEYFGHVHSTAWFAAGLVRLGRLIGEGRYIEKGKAIYDFTRSLSSSFGWVPEYAKWRPLAEEHCETCCIRDMIFLAAELIDCGHAEYWTDLNSFARNMLVENQIDSGAFVAVDNTLADTDEATWRDLDRRVVGGFSGGTEPNAISLRRFRSIAGCCVGTAPQAIQLVWNRAVEYSRKRLTVNLPVDKTTRHGEVEMGYPNEGYIRVTPKRPMDVAIRLYPWMPAKLQGRLGGRRKAFDVEDGLAVFRNCPAGKPVELRHVLRTRTVKEEVAERVYTETWRGPDLVDLRPRAEPGDLRLWQREEGRKKKYPKPPAERTEGTGLYAQPTQQKR